MENLRNILISLKNNEINLNEAETLILNTRIFVIRFSENKYNDVIKFDINEAQKYINDFNSKEGINSSYFEMTTLRNVI